MTKTEQVKRFRLAIFGSRCLHGMRVNAAILSAIDAHSATMLVTAGEPKGVCEAARDIASILPMPITLFYTDLARCAGKYHWRSVAVYENCDHVLLIHDGKSAGTKNEIKLAEKLGIPYTVVILEGVK